MNLSVESRSNGRKLVILAPYLSDVPKGCRNASVNSGEHEWLLAGMQRLRGAVYLEDGAIASDSLTSDGRHRQAVDDRSWHLLSVDEEGKVCGCARYLRHASSSSFEQLEVVKSALAGDAKWGESLRSAVGRDLSLAARRGLPYVEAGGWALAPEVRRTTEALRVALGTFALAQFLGGCIGLSTATLRNCSAAILKRIGGSVIENEGAAIPAYFDSQYGCYMEVIRFDSDAPNSKFARLIRQMSRELASVPVICGRQGAAAPLRAFAPSMQESAFGTPAPAF